jgi:hypothetical protein
VPKGWSAETQKPLGEGLPTAKLKNDTDVLLITLISPNETSLKSQDQMDQFLREQAKPFEQASVEGKTTVLHESSSHLLCSYANYTDKALVGKPVIPENWKYTTMGFAKLGTSLVHFTYFTNEGKNLANGTGVSVIKTLRLTSSAKEAQASSFFCELREHQVNITVPEIPAMTLAEHPLRKSIPYLKYMGSEGPYNASIITPTIDRGMSSLEFADARVKQRNGDVLGKFLFDSYLWRNKHTWINEATGLRMKEVVGISETMSNEITTFEAIRSTNPAGNLPEFQVRNRVCTHCLFQQRAAD